MKKIQASLPDKPSKLIRIALKHLAYYAGSPGYHICMGANWLYQGSTTCHMCYAGAVMRGYLAVKPEYHNSLSPAMFEHHVASKLHALNNFRLGYPQLGLMDWAQGDTLTTVYRHFKLTPPQRDALTQDLNRWSSLDYREYEPLDPKPFHESQEKLASIFERHGL
jgi:hypothetical protein